MISKNKEAGFSLIELLLVLAIMGIALTAGMIQLNRGTIGYKVRSYQERLVQELRGARTEALARNARVQLIIDTGDFTYRSELIASPDNIVLSSAGENNPLRNVRVTMAEFTDNNRVIFDGRGRVTNISAANGRGMITVASGASRRQIRIYADTGFIESINGGGLP